MSLRAADRSPVIPILIGILLFWQGALTFLVFHERMSTSHPLGPAAQGPLSLKDLVMGILLLDMDDQVALTSLQARQINAILNSIEQFLEQPDTSSSSQDRRMLEAYLAHSVLHPAQLDWIAREKAIIQDASGAHLWADQTRMGTSLRQMIVARCKAHPTLLLPSGSPTTRFAQSTAFLSRLDFMRGLLILETDRDLRVNRSQAIQLQRTMTTSDAQEDPRHRKAALQEAVPDETLAILNETQIEMIRPGARCILYVDNRPPGPTEVEHLVEQLLQQRANGQTFPHRVTMPSGNPLPSAAPASGASPTADAKNPGAAPSAAPASSASPTADAKNPGAAPSAPSDLRTDRARHAHPLIFTQILLGVLALEHHPALSMSRAQALQFQPLLPDIRQIMSELAHQQPVPTAMTTENAMRQILRKAQVNYIAAHVPVSGPMEDVLENFTRLLRDRVQGVAFHPLIPHSLIPRSPASHRR